MSWLERIRPSEPEAEGDESDREAPAERPSPGLGALFEALTPDGGHSILDLGHAESRRLRLLGRFARRIRFADLVPEVPEGRALEAALERMRPHDTGPYDVVLAWDVLDRLDPGARIAVMERIVEITAPGARLYALVYSETVAVRQPIRWAMQELDRVVAEPVGPPEPGGAPLLPRQVERLLEPFEVVTAVSLRHGLREYVARRPIPGSARTGG